VQLQPSVVHSTFVLERSFPKPPAKVFAAFADPAKKRRWYAEGEGHDIQDFASDFRVGGIERLRYRLKPGTPVAGKVIQNEIRFQDIVPDRRIVTATVLDLEGQRILVSLVTFEFLPTEAGTDLICTHQGSYLEFPQGPGLLEAGWRGLLDSLAKELA